MIRSKQIPFISIVTPTLNAEKGLPHLFTAIAKQIYPKNKIEVIVADGGSVDNTEKIAKIHKATYISNKYVLAEPGIYLAMKKAKGDLIMVLASDNIYTDKNAFLKIAKVFEREEIYAAFPKHDSQKKDTLFTKYINQFTDPVNHFVYGNAANARTFHRIYKTLEHNDVYDIYDFNSNKTTPILALAQGFTVKKEFITYRKNMFDDITPVRDIFIKKRIAYIHSLSLYHHTIRDMNHFIRKQRWLTMIALKDKRFGISLRTQKFTTWQRIKFYLYPFYSMTIIFPIFRSFYGFFEDKSTIWFFHPIISIISVYAIFYELVRIGLRIGKDPSRL